MPRDTPIIKKIAERCPQCGFLWIEHPIRDGEAECHLFEVGTKLRVTR